MDIDQNYLRTRTAMCFRAFHRENTVRMAG